MAIATNTTEGEIVLSGDLSGNGSSPQLRASGVVPGSYPLPAVVVDSKGRIIFSKNIVSSEIDWPIASLLDSGIFYANGSTGLISTQNILRLDTAQQSGAGGTIQPDNTTILLSGGSISVSLPISSNMDVGLVKIGNQLNVDSNGVVSRVLAGVASTSATGYVTVGSGFQLTAGTISISQANPSLPSVVRINIGSPESGGWNFGNIETPVLGLHLTGNDVPGIIYDPANEFEIGSGLSVDNSGFLNYSLSSSLYGIASSSTLGAVRIGSGFVSNDGLLSINGLGPSTASSTGTVVLSSTLPGLQVNDGTAFIQDIAPDQYGVFSIDSNSLFVESNGALRTRRATISTISVIGCVLVPTDGGFAVDSTGAISLNTEVVKSNARNNFSSFQSYAGNIKRIHLTNNSTTPIDLMPEADIVVNAVYTFIITKSPDVVVRPSLGFGAADGHLGSSEVQLGLGRVLDFSSSEALKLTCIGDTRTFGNKILWIMNYSIFEL